MSTTQPPPITILTNLFLSPKDPNNNSTENIPSADLNKVIDIITNAFADIALGHTFITEIDSTPPPYPSEHVASFARRRRHFEPGIVDYAVGNAIFLRSGNPEDRDWSAVAIWEPPWYKGKPFAENPAIAGGAVRAEWKEKIRAAKAKYLAPLDGKAEFRPFWHLSFLARNPDVPSVKGAISACVKPYLERAVADNAPVWLEATTPYAVGIYQAWGFRLLETVTIGVGAYGKNGWPQEGGEGVNGFFLIYDKHLKQENGVSEK